jgi:hypothetical protein
MASSCAIWISLAAVSPPWTPSPTSSLEVGDSSWLAAGKIWVVDFGTGTVLQSFDHREKLGVLFGLDLSTITTGPHAGAFGPVDTTNNELVVFRLE